ncbi:lysine N-methyltransferase [Aureococcus anophagefferens]|nr:lysine N-methyltransferase [Aureococcus anophagefferens]
MFKCRPLLSTKKLRAILGDDVLLRPADDGGEPDARWLSILVCKKRKSYRGDRCSADGGAKAAFDATRAAFARAGLDTRASSSRPGSANARIVTRGSRPGPEYARIVTPAPSKMPPRKSKKAKTESKSSLAQIALENLLCPITHRLPVRPALAADGHVYERSAIEQWLQTKSTSPLTSGDGNGDHGFDARRTLIQSAIENGGVDEDAAATWHLESAKLIATGKMPGSISSVKDHLELADALSSSPEIKLLLEAVDLKVQQDALLKRGADAGVGCVASVLGVEKMSFTPMPAWRELRVGKSVIRIMDDAAEAERLCERPAPGADSCVNWDPSMAQCCGKVYVVKRILPVYKARH